MNRSNIIGIILVIILISSTIISNLTYDICKDYCASKNLAFNGKVTEYLGRTVRSKEESFIISTTNMGQIQVVKNLHPLFNGLAMGDSVYKRSGSLECTIVRVYQLPTLTFYFKEKWKEFNLYEISSCDCNYSK